MIGILKEDNIYIYMPEMNPNSHVYNSFVQDTLVLIFYCAETNGIFYPYRSHNFEVDW